jgi:hypothetical protein
MTVEVHNKSSRRLMDTAVAVGLVVIFYPMTIAPIGWASNGGLLGLGSLTVASHFSWRAFVLNCRSPWLRRLLQAPLAASITYLAIREAFVQSLVGWSHSFRL